MSKKKKKLAKKHENKIHNNSVAQPKKIPAMIIWNGIKLSLKKNSMHPSKIENALMVCFGYSRVV